jgi:hypothetical protein
VKVITEIPEKKRSKQLLMLNTIREMVTLSKQHPKES